MCSFFFWLLKLPPSHSHWSRGGGNIVYLSDDHKVSSSNRQKISPEEFEEGNDEAEMSK